MKFQITTKTKTHIDETLENLNDIREDLTHEKIVPNSDPRCHPGREHQLVNCPCSETALRNCPVDPISGKLIPM